VLPSHADVPLPLLLLLLLLLLPLLLRAPPGQAGCGGEDCRV
jgi:hypothetical protein